jgi:phosphonoacetaldehyde hydrolase
MYRYVRKYVGPLKACILDWSGTTADKYVIAPAVVFRDVFHKHGVPITMAEARLPMGLRKDLHIAEILQIPEVAERWELKHGVPPNEKDVEKMFADFVPLQLACLPDYSTLIYGTKQAVYELRRKYNLKIGMTTGFTREMVDVLLKETRAQGYSPDCAVAGDDVIHGARPGPFMVYKNLDILDISPIQSVVKVDDTIGGIGEGLAAGCWTIGVSRYSNYMDVDSLEHERSLSMEELEARNKKSREILQSAGAHYVVDTIADVPAVVESINIRLRLGIMPYSLTI